MPRRVTRPLVIPVRPWIATLNGFGAWVLLDETGHDPLRHPDPLIQLENIHVAARSRTLREALEKLARRYAVIASNRSADEEVLRIAFGEIVASRVPLKEVARAEDRRGQRELDLAA